MGRPQASLDAALTPPPFPSALDYLWRWFLEISSGLMITGTSPSVITWEGLAAWQSLMRVTLAPREAQALVRLGNLRAAVLSERSKIPPPSEI